MDVGVETIMLHDCGVQSPCVCLYVFTTVYTYLLQFIHAETDSNLAPQTWHLKSGVGNIESQILRLKSIVSSLVSKK